MLNIFRFFLGVFESLEKKPLNIMPLPKSKGDLSWSHILPQNHRKLRLSLPSNWHLVEVEIEETFLWRATLYVTQQKATKLNSHQWWSNHLYLDLLKILGFFANFSDFCSASWSLFEIRGGFPKYRRTCQVMSFDITLILAVWVYHTWMFQGTL